MRLIALVVAIAAIWLGIPQVAAAVVAPATPTATYNYDGCYRAAVAADLATERGPPTTGHHYTPYDGAHRWSHGAPARLKVDAIDAYTGYDTLAVSARTVRGGTTTEGQVRRTDGDLSPLAPSGVAANGVSRLVPGGGLAAHEAAGGHALARHVGMTDADLLARLSAQPGISGASSFSSRAVAESSVAGLLDANASGISSWLAGSGGKLVLNGTGGITGRYVAQGSTSISNVTGVRAVLVRDANMSIGYRIQTAFPTP